MASPGGEPRISPAVSEHTHNSSAIIAHALSMVFFFLMSVQLSQNCCSCLRLKHLNGNIRGLTDCNIPEISCSKVGCLMLERAVHRSKEKPDRG